MFGDMAGTPLARDPAASISKSGGVITLTDAAFSRLRKASKQALARAVQRQPGTTLVMVATGFMHDAELSKALTQLLGYSAAVTSQRAPVTGEHAGCICKPGAAFIQPSSCTQQLTCFTAAPAAAAAPGQEAVYDYGYAVGGGCAMQLHYESRASKGAVYLLGYNWDAETCPSQAPDAPPPHAPGSSGPATQDPPRCPNGLSEPSTNLETCKSVGSNSCIYSYDSCSADTRRHQVCILNCCAKTVSHACAGGATMYDDSPSKVEAWGPDDGPLCRDVDPETRTAFFFLKDGSAATGGGCLADNGGRAYAYDAPSSGMGLPATCSAFTYPSAGSKQSDSGNTNVGGCAGGSDGECLWVFDAGPDPCTAT